jgi:hypothetical protein
MSRAAHLAIACLATAWLAVAASAPAAAQAYHYASAGAACQPANGALAKFTYNLHFLTNTGTTDQTVVCHLGMDDAGGTPKAHVFLNVQVYLPATGTTVTCLAQTGGFYGEGTHIQASTAKTLTSSTPNQYGALSWTGAELPRENSSVIVTLNCKLPPGARMGTIGRVEE